MRMKGTVLTKSTDFIILKGRKENVGETMKRDIAVELDNYLDALYVSIKVSKTNRHKRILWKNATTW